MSNYTKFVLAEGNKVLLSLPQTQFLNKKLTIFLVTEAAFPYCNWLMKMARIIWFGSISVDICIGAKLNLYCKSIELVFGGSPKLCVLVEWKAQDRVNSEL